MTFGDFWNSVDGDIETVWFVTVACPAGEEWTHNVGPDVPDEDYCDLGEMAFSGQFAPVWGLEGTVEDGVWKWDGAGDVWFPAGVGSSLLNLKAFATKSDI